MARVKTATGTVMDTFEAMRKGVTLDQFEAEINEPQGPKTEWAIQTQMDYTGNLFVLSNKGRLFQRTGSLMDMKWVEIAGPKEKLTFIGFTPHSLMLGVTEDGSVMQRLNKSFNGEVKFEWTEVSGPEFK